MDIKIIKYFDTMYKDTTSLRMYKFYVSLYDRDDNLLKSTTVIASSEIEAINKIKDDKWWYEEGTGYKYKPYNYPLTFKAVIR